MNNLEFYKLGTNPEEEAERTRTLYSDSGVDSCVIDEFETTVHAYTTLAVAEIANRLKSRYGGDQPTAYGIIPVYNCLDLGMAIWGEKDFYNIGETEETPGINVSAWLLSQYRRQGFGNEVIAYATNQAVALGKELNKQIWTSIKPQNTASRRACESAGFVEAGIQPDKTDRLLYIL